MFSRIGNLIYRSSESKNSASYVNRQSLNLTLDPSGTDFIEYSTDSAYFTDAHSLIPNSESQTTTTALKFQDSATPANNFFLSSLGDFTLCVKHKLNASSTSTDIISHYFDNPQFDISFAEPYIRENSPFNVIVSKASNGPVEYEVSGNLIASDLTNGDISGNVYTVESVLPFTLNTGTGGNDFVFSLKNLDASLNAPIYSQYYVTSSTNILGETVFAFSPTGTEGTYNNQLDLSFGANSKMIFNVSDSTMTDFSLVFGTTVDDINTRNESVVTRINDLVIVDISAGYDGDRLVYFEDSSAGMGYLPAGGGGGGGDSDAVINLSFDTDGTNSGSYGSSGDMTITHDTIDTANAKYGNGALYINSSASGYARSYIPTVFSNTPQNCCISLWMKVDTHIRQNHNIFSTKVDTTYNLIFGFTSQTQFLLYMSGGDNGTINIPNTINPFDNTYHHYFFKIEGQKATVFVDDTLIGDRTFSTPITDKPMTEFKIGDTVTTNSPTAYYDDVRIFDKIVSIDEANKEIPLTVHYTVDVGNSVLRLDSGSGFVEKLAVSFNSGTTYIFDQSHDSNANNTLIIGTAPDISSSIVSSGLTIMGTPGQAGAYTKYVSDGSLVYYFSYQTENMGEEPPTYTVKVVDHEVTGEKVFSIQAPGTSTFINQPDLSFGAGDKYQFDVGDLTMADISLVFGTTVDDSTSINETVVTRYEGMILLDISAGYDGDRLVYFEDSSAGMGYAPASSFHQTPTTDVPVSRQPYSNPSKEFNVIKYNYAGSVNTTFALENTQLILDFINEHYDGNTLTVGSETASTFKESQRLYYMHNDTIYYMFLMWFDAPWISPDPSDNYYSVISENNTELEANYPEAWGPRDYWLSDYGTGSGTSTGPGERHDYGTNVGNEQPYNLVDYANIGIPTSGNITVYYGDPLIPLSNVEYTITVVSGVFHVDGSPTPILSLINGVNYVFDQSDSTNTGNTLVIGTAFDVSTSIVSSGLTIMGTPGQPGAYTHYVSDGSPVYYFSYQTENMGEKPPMYTVKVDDHEVTGEKVFSIQAPGTSTFINQPDLSFGAGDRYQFDVTDSTMTDISLVFGTTVDDISTRNESVVSRYEGTILLDIGAGYDGDRLVYFEDSSAGMGYVSSSGSGSGTAPQLLNSSFESNTLVGTGNTFGIYYTGSGTSINDWTTIGPSSVSNRTFIVKEGDNNMPLPTPFVDGSYCFGLEVNTNQNTGYLQQIITLPVNNYNLSWYDVRRSQGSGYDQPNNTSPIRIKITKEADSTVIHTHEYLVTNTTWTEKTTSFSITEEANYIVSFETYFIDGNTGQSAFDKVTFSIAQPPVENYTVDVGNSAFRLDSGDGNGFVEKPAIDFANNSGTSYIFDQSDSTNAGNTLVIGSFDVSSSIVSTGLTIMGTPGQPGAYTKYVSDGSTVHYFSYQTENMGTASPPPNITDDLYVHYDFEFPLYDPNGTERTDGLTGNNTDVRVYNKAYDSSTNSDISYNGYLAPFGSGARLDSTVQKFGSSSVKIHQSAVRSEFVWNLDSLQGFSMCIWMKEESASGNLMGAGSPLVFEISYNNSTFTVNISGTTMSYTYTNSDITNITDWNHIAFTMSSDGKTWKLYINGNLVQTKTDGIYFTQTGTINYVDIGAKPGLSTYIGYFDDFRFYKTELDQAKISAVYSYTG